MRAAAVCLVLFACTAAVHGARRPVDTFKNCANFSALRDPRLAATVQLIKKLDLLPAGIPDDLTLFLPTNDSLKAVLVGGPIPSVSSDLDVILSKPLIPEIAWRLNAVFLYHMANIGPATAAELVDEGVVPTVLGPDYNLKFAAGRGKGTYTVSDARGIAANTKEASSLCGSSLFVIDKVLLPAQSFEDIPLVNPTEALCLLTGLGCRAPALGLDPPSSGEEAPAAPAPAPAPAAAP
ncbi:hypothetical protein ABPG75_010990 [Micractinium tetrahymenae]